jgi:hypothetical protein
MNSSRLIQDLMVREALRELRARYCWCVARGDYESMTQMYTADGLFEFMLNGSRVDCRGHAAIREWLKKATPPGLVFPMVHNEVFIINGDDAVGTCGMEARTTSPEISFFSGYYHDRFRRVDGQWLFSERRFYRYWPNFEQSGLDIYGVPTKTS